MRLGRLLRWAIATAGTACLASTWTACGRFNAALDETFEAADGSMDATVVTPPTGNDASGNGGDGGPFQPDAGQVSDAQATDAQATDAQATDAQATDAQATDAQATDASDHVDDGGGTKDSGTDAGFDAAVPSSCPVGDPAAGCVGGTVCTPCPQPANAVSNCNGVGGTCSFDCPGTSKDCDHQPGNGCETDTTSSPANCGACGAPCGGGSPICQSSLCVAACNQTACPDGTCVDLMTSTTSCGACGYDCASAAHMPPNTTVDSCTNGACIYKCLAAYRSCNGTHSAGDHDGCETLVNGGDTDNCGGCGVVCAPRPNAIPLCNQGNCSDPCVYPYDDCDGMPGNGCEADLTNPMTCGSCTNLCPSGQRSSPSCAADGTCGITCTFSGGNDCDGDPATGCECPGACKVTKPECCSAVGGACTVAEDCCSASAGCCANKTCGLGCPVN